MKKYLFTGFVSTAVALLIFIFWQYSIDQQCVGIYMSSGRDCAFLEYLYGMLFLIFIFGGFITVPIFLTIAIANSYILRTIDIHLINTSFLKKKIVIFTVGILIPLISGGILFLSDYLTGYLDDYYIYYVVYCIAGYVCGIAIRKLFGRWNWGNTACNIERKGVISSIAGAFILTAISLYFSSNYGIYKIPVLMIVVGFMLYESNNRWCILRSFGKKTQIPESNEGQIIPTENPGN